MGNRKTEDILGLLGVWAEGGQEWARLSAAWEVPGCWASVNQVCKCRELSQTGGSVRPGGYLAKLLSPKLREIDSKSSLL